jgi:hypothetical protein
LETQLEEALRILYAHGAENWDQNLAFFFCGNGEVVNIDLKEVEYLQEPQAWEHSIDLGSVGHLTSCGRDARDPSLPPSPVASWTTQSGNNYDKEHSGKGQTKDLIHVDMKQPTSITVAFKKLGTGERNGPGENSECRSVKIEVQSCYLSDGLFNKDFLHQENVRFIALIGP